MEWVFFIVEITTIAVYYYTWDRIAAEAAPEGRLALRRRLVVHAGDHQRHSDVHADARRNMARPWQAPAQEASKFWNAFFNPTYWPSLVLRTLVCISLAGVWALMTASRIDGEKFPELKTSYLRWTTRGWCLPSFSCPSLSAGTWPWCRNRSALYSPLASPPSAQAPSPR